MFIHYLSDAFLEGRYTEVDKQSDRQVREAQVDQQLLGMDRGKLLHGFQLDLQAAPSTSKSTRSPPLKCMPLKSKATDT